MNNKGFTLTELIVTMAIMAVITMISLPAIDKVQSENRQTIYESYGKVLLNGAKLYVDKYDRDLFKRNVNLNQCVSINYADLINEDLIKPFKGTSKEKIVNDMSKNEIPYVNATKKDGHVTYEVSLKIKKGNNLVYDKSSSMKCNHVDISASNSELKKLSSVQIGSYVKMKPDKEKYAISSDKTGSDSSKEFNLKELNIWRIINVDQSGTVEMISDKTTSVSLSFSGNRGYQNALAVLQELALQYSNSKYVISARCPGYNNQALTLDDVSFMDKEPSDGVNYGQDDGYISDFQKINSFLITTKADSTDQANYWIASRVYDQNGDVAQGYYQKFGLRYVSSNGELQFATLKYNTNTANQFNENIEVYFRPIVTIKSDVMIKNGNGLGPNSAYELN